MRYTHKYINERLPDYISLGEIPDYVRVHLTQCPICKEEYELLKALTASIDVKEPDGLFFETLPVRIKISVKEREPVGWLMRLVPAFAIFIIVISTGFFYINNKGSKVYYVSADPLESQYIDISGLKAEDIKITINVSGDNGIIAPSESPLDYNYNRDLASLDTDQLNGLYEAIDNKTKTGGV